MANKPFSFSAEGIFGEERNTEELLAEINADEELKSIFAKIPEEKKKHLLAFLAGKSTLDILYDSFFRKIFDPELHRERLERLISAFLGRKAMIQSVLSREGFQVSDKGSLVIMDIIVKLEDNSFLNVELQKIGYRFPAQRSSCYVSDMIMRQYNLKKAETKKGADFNYRDIAPVYLLVILAQSSKEFSGTNEYIHRRETSYSSGIELPETARITYITLDTFRKKPHNIDNELEAWLTFLTEDDLERVMKLINKYPEFADIYKDIAEFRKDPKELIGMFSEALKILDHNTELFMIDEMKADNESLKKDIKKKDDVIRQQGEEIRQRDEEIRQQGEEIRQKEEIILQLNRELEAFRTNNNG